MTTVNLTPGDTAPPLALPDSSGTVRSLADFAPSTTVVYFYPKAFTPGCTTQACDFRDNLASLQSAGYTVIGISPDTVETLAEFATAEALSYPLLSDVDSVAARAWGAWGAKVVNGQQLVGPLRCTFIIDADSTVRHAEYNVTATGHVAALREQLGV